MPLCENPFNEMRFKSEAPFDKYSKGRIYYREGRRHLNLWGQHGTKKMTVARYLYMRHLFKETGEILLSDFDVHHKNENAMDDRLANFEAVHESLHQQKHTYDGTTLVDLVCVVCRSIVTRQISKSNLHHNEKNRRGVVCCSSSHAAAFRFCNISDETRENLEELQIVETYKQYRDGTRESIKKYNTPLLDSNWKLLDIDGGSVDFSFSHLQPKEQLSEAIKGMRLKGLSYSEISRNTNISYNRVVALSDEPSVHLGYEARRSEITLQIVDLRKQGLSFAEISRRLNISPVQSRLWSEEMLGTHRTDSQISELVKSISALREINISAGQISRKLKISKTTIQRYMKKYGIG